MFNHGNVYLRLSFLVLILCTLLCSFVVMPSFCFAEKITVTASGQYLISKNEKISDGEAFALIESLRSAVETVAVRVTSYTKVVNNVLEEDIVETFASSVVKITDKQVKPVIEGDNIVIKVTITAVVDTADIEKWTPPDLEKQRQLENDNKELREQILKEKREKLISSTGRSSGSTTELAAIALERVQPLISAGKYHEADRIITDTIKGGIEHAELYYQRGWLNMTTRQYGAAVADFNRAFQISQDPKCLKGKADANFHLGKYEMAMMDYNRVISTNPGDASSWANRGACYWALGNGHQAVRNYDTAVNLGNEMAGRIRHILEGQYERGTYVIKKTARKVLPLC